MGKYIEEGLLPILMENMLVFEVVVAVHGKKKHREIYSFDRHDYDRIRGLGYFDGVGENTMYLDWKPKKGEGMRAAGGAKKVEQYTFDAKYVYAHTKEGQVFSLPRYLFDKIPQKTEIFVGRREYALEKKGVMKQKLEIWRQQAVHQSLDRMAHMERAIEMVMKEIRQAKKDRTYKGPPKEA